MNTGMSLITQADVEAARKVKMLLPYGDKLTDDNALALMAYSRLHALDPFNGECYFLVREKKDDSGKVVSREELGVYPGIKGKRKKSKEQLANVDPQAWYKVDYEAADPGEIGIKVANDIALVIKATLRDSISGGRYIVDTIKLKQAGLTKAEIEDIIGKPPVWVGYGVVKNYELRYIKQTPLALAKKRAESDATNQRFDLPFANESLAEDIAPEFVEQLESGDDPNDEPIIEGEARTVAENMNALGYDEPFFTEHDTAPDEHEPEPSEQPEQPRSNASNTGFNPVAAIVEWGHAQNNYEAAAILNKSPYAKTKMTPDELKAWTAKYRGWRDTGLGVADAAAKATAGDVPK